MVSTNNATGTAMSSRDLRRNARYHVDVRIRVFVTKNGKKQVIHGRGNDISETGMALFAPQELLLEDRIEVEFTLPYSRQPLLIGAVIRNRTGYRYGVEFFTLSTPQRDEIIKLCKTLTLLQ
jgi:c-di-GMP-binding flagellar brake protein YcgR